MLKIALNINMQSISAAGKSRVWNSNTVEIISRQICSCLVRSQRKATETEATAFPKPAKKTQIGPKITLISPDDSVSVVTLDNAQKLSKRRDMKLVQIMDMDKKTERPVYKLMTGAEYFQIDLKRRAEKSLKKDNAIKDAKLLQISVKMMDHDLNSKIKNMVKWLHKHHEVRIVISFDENQEAAERMYGLIEEGTKEAGKAVQKRVKGAQLRFQVVPFMNKKVPDPEVAQPEESPSDTVQNKSEIN